MNPRPATKRAEMPEGTSSILERRTLAKDFRVLYDILRPGQSVLDFGCGSGSLTIDVATRVSPGEVVGADISLRLLEQARGAAKLKGQANVSFVEDDIYNSKLNEQFDVVASARMLQWLEFPERALVSLTNLTLKGGSVVVLDYNHLKAQWSPEPPKSFQKFYKAFVEWRASSGMDNEVGDHLELLMNRAGLHEIETVPQVEVSSAGSESFLAELQIWRGVAESRGHQIVADGYLTEYERKSASDDYFEWMNTKATEQSLYLVGAIGRR